MDDYEEIYTDRRDHKARLIYRWSLRGQLQRKRIGLYRRGCKWWLTMGAVVGTAMGCAAGAFLIWVWGW